MVILEVWLMCSFAVCVLMAVTLATAYVEYKATGKGWIMDKNDIVPFVTLVLMGPLTPFIFMWVIHGYGEK